MDLHAYTSTPPQFSTKQRPDGGEDWRRVSRLSSDKRERARNYKVSKLQEPNEMRVGRGDQADPLRDDELRAQTNSIETVQQELPFFGSAAAGTIGNGDCLGAEALQMIVYALQKKRDGIFLCI
jgi:hypothetical protein